MSRVLLLNVTAGVGSTGKIVTGIYDNLVSHGYECMIAYGRFNAPPGYNSYRIGSDLDVNMHGVLSRITDKQGLYSKAATKRFIEKIKEFNPDIVHIHNIHGYYVNYKMLFEFLKNSEIRVIWTLHDCWPLTGHCTHFEFVGCERYQEECGKCMQLKEYPKSLLFDRSKKNLILKRSLFSNIPGMKIVTPSSWLKGVLSNSYMKNYPVSVIPTGIDLSVFRPKNSELLKKYDLEDKFVILGVANPWRDRKGFGEFIKLSKYIPAHYKIVMIGLKPEQIDVIKSAAPSVIALGRTDSIEEMAQWYAAATVYANLTLEDTFPTTNIESLACGTPVITYNVGGAAESISKGTGFVVEKCDVEAVLLACNEIENNIIDPNACLRQAANYSKEDRFEQYYEEVYRTL